MFLLTIRDDSELVKVLEFLQTSKIQFQIQDSDRFEKLLYQGIDSEKIQHSCLRDEKYFKHLQKIEDDLVSALEDDDIGEIQEYIQNIREFRRMIDADLNGELMNTHFIPTEHFKGYCGPEWLAPEGKITPISVLTFLDMQLKNRNIPIVNGVIHTTEWLRTLLEDGREFILYGDLPRIIFRLLRK